MLLGEIEVLKKAQIKVGSIFRMEFYPKDRVTPKGEHAIGRTNAIDRRTMKRYGLE